MSSKLISGLLGLSLSLVPIAALGQAAAAGDEPPAKFVQRYLDTLAAAKSPKQLLPYLKPRPDMPPMPDKISDEEMKMIGAFMEMQKASTPLKAEITGTQERNGQVLLLLKAIQVEPQSKLNLSEAGASASGKMVLEKGANGWLLAGEYWHYVYPNGLTTNTGIDPDAATAVASPIDKYSDDIITALNKVWLDPAKGTGQVTVEFENNGAGNFKLIGVSDKHGSKEAEAAVSEAMAKIALPPLPDQVSEQPFVNIQLCWSPKSKDTVKVVQLLHSATLVK